MRIQLLDPENDSTLAKCILLKEPIFKWCSRGFCGTTLKIGLHHDSNLGPYNWLCDQVRNQSSLVMVVFNLPHSHHLFDRVYVSEVSIQLELMVIITADIRR